MITYSEAIRQAMTDCMKKDQDVFLMGEDIGIYGGAFGVSRGMLKEFGPDRIINTPLSEASFTGVAIGAALLGARPIVEIMFMDFITLAVDQLVNQAAKLHYVYGKQAKCPIVIRAVSGAGRNYGPTHSQNLEAWFCHTPGIKVVAPTTVADAYSMMQESIYDDNPVLFLEHKLLYPQKEDCKLKPVKTKLSGPKRLLKGDDVTIVSYSYMTVEALAAAKVLERNGVSVDLIDLRVLNPLDETIILESVKNTGRLLIVAEENQSCGIAAEIGCRVSEKVYDYMDAPIKRLTVPDVPISASPSLEKAALPNRAKIIQAVNELMEY
jgi:pyruvate/2-oxoglutarate/acetoin dehydrogenase E1 component